MATRARDEIRALVERNIREHGFHTYLVGAAVAPRFVYTIGLAERGLPELILAGAALYSGKEAAAICGALARKLLAGATLSACELVPGVTGDFSARPARRAWVDALMLGAVERHGDVRALQIVPDASTVDVPDMTQQGGPVADAVWRWIVDARWPHAVPARSVVATHVAVLRGERATEAARWEEDLWEIFAGPGPDVPPDEMRVVPLATLLGADPTLRAVLTLEIGQALRRASGDEEWRAWRQKR